MVKKYSDGKKYLTVSEKEKLQNDLQVLMLKRYGLKVHVGYHPKFLQVPTEEFYEGD